MPLATLLLATTLIVGPERPLTPDGKLVPAAASDPMVAQAGNQVLVAWSENHSVPPGQRYRLSSTRGRFLGQTRDFEIFPSWGYGFEVTSDGDSFYAIALNQDRVPFWRRIGRYGEIGPLHNIEGVGTGDGWWMTATSSRLVFASTNRILIADHDGHVLKEVKPAHLAGPLVSVGEDFYFIESERLSPNYEVTDWLTRLTPAGEMSSELLGSFSDTGSNDAGESALPSGIHIPSSPALVEEVATMTKTNGAYQAKVGWDGHEFGIVSCARRDDRFVTTLTRFGRDGKIAGTDVIGSGFCPNGFWTAGGKTTVLGSVKDGVADGVGTISAPSFAAMAREKPKPEPFRTAEVRPVQHSVALAARLAVWSEGRDFEPAICARLLPGGRPFTIAPLARRPRSAAAAVATRNGYVVAWSELEKVGAAPKVVLQAIDRSGALSNRAEVPGGPFDVFTSIKPAIASNGETIALVTGGVIERNSLRLRLFDSRLEQLSTVSVSEIAGADPIALASFRSVMSVPKPPEGHVDWNGRQYVVSWLEFPKVKYAFFDHHGAVWRLNDRELEWTTLQTTAIASEVIAAGVTSRPPEWKSCLEITSLDGKLEIASLAGKRLSTYCVPRAPDNRVRRSIDDRDWFEYIQPVLFSDLILITQRKGDAYDVLVSPIEPDPEFVCVSCTALNEQGPAATTIGSHTYIVYERADPDSDDTMRLFYREIRRSREVR